MAGFTKLFHSILHSTIWREPDHVRIVWITMLALADQHGEVMASVPGLADISRVTRQQCEQALAVLAAPDPDSRNQEHGGRRVNAIDGGWLVLNYSAYRQRMSKDERRDKDRIRKQKQRQRELEAQRARGLDGIASDAVDRDKA
jgi:hypothetical protein